MRRLTPLLLLLVLAACATTTPTTPAVAPCNSGLTLVNATLYVRSSAEFRANATQTFAAARRALDEALADRTRVGALEETNADPSQPPALIVDMDETVLDNTMFEERVIAKGTTYDETMWKEWTKEGAATAIPGAQEFLTYAQSRGVTVFYITNRDEDERAGTLANIRKLAYPIDDAGANLMLRENKESDKSARRQRVADQYRILLMAGDDLNDFVNLRRAPWQERDQFITDRKDWWGTRWFMIANPMYGSFENAAIGSGGTDCEKLERKLNALKP
ncbi:MAG TPA: HAD family acid phosphatase [Thermoanaerobaculia bacterium]|jgi:acid phosphatase